MKLTTTNTATTKSITEIDLNGRISMPITGSRSETIDSQVESVVILDNYVERDSLEKFLKKKKYKRSDGIFGDQHDYSIGSRKLGEKAPWEIIITLQVQGVDAHNKMRDCVKEWAHKYNSKKTKIPA